MDIGYIWNLFVAQLYLLKIREEENIYKWEPKYSVYTETQTVDGETTEVNLKLNLKASLYLCSDSYNSKLVHINIKFHTNFLPSAGGLVYSTGPCKETLFLAVFQQRLAGAQVWLQFL